MGKSLYTGRIELESGMLNVRAKPEGEVIGALENGAEVSVLGQNGDWLEVTHGTGTGYIAARYVRFVRAPQDARLIIEDGAGNTFMPVGGFTARIVTGEID